MKVFPTVLSICTLAAMFAARAICGDSTESSNRDGQPVDQISSSEYSIAHKSEWHIIPNRGNWWVVLSRWKRTDIVSLDQSKLRVVVCRGFDCTGSPDDEQIEPNLENYLARHGFEVWSVGLHEIFYDQELRNTGQTLRLATEGCAWLNPRDCRESFKFISDEVMPVVLRRLANVNQIVWIGHGLGADTMLAHLSRQGPNPALGGLVTIGCSFLMPNGRPYFVNTKEKQSPIGSERRTYSHVATRRNALSDLETVFDRSMIEGTSVGVINQSLLPIDWSPASNESYRLDPSDDDLFYLASMHNVTCPFLAIGGSADPIAPPTVQQWLCENVQSSDRSSLTIGKTSGAAVDYRRADLLNGVNSARDVFPKIADWLNGKR